MILPNWIDHELLHPESPVSGSLTPRHPRILLLRILLATQSRFFQASAMKLTSTLAKLGEVASARRDSTGGLRKFTFGEKYIYALPHPLN
jgi:hypothetical protein